MASAPIGPEAVARSNPRRRERFLDSYVADLVARDVAHLSDIERAAQMRALVRLLAARSAAGPAVKVARDHGRG